MSIEGPGREQLRTLGARLKDAGPEGQGLRRALVKQMGDAAEPLAREIASVDHLKPYFPDRYAAVLSADLAVSTQRIFAGSSPRVSIVAKAREHRRKIGMFNDLGVINHPVFAQGPRRRPRSPALIEEAARKHGIPVSAVRGWTWVNGQTAGMERGFFTEPCEKAAPDVINHILDALAETARKITDGR